MYECRCDERLQSKTKEFTCLIYTGLVVELEHLKIVFEFNFRNQPVEDSSTFTVWFSLVKVAAVRITLNLDGASITSTSHTHPRKLANFSFINLVTIFSRMFCAVFLPPSRAQYQNIVISVRPEMTEQV
jgi:hypothetical protein